MNYGAYKRRDLQNCKSLAMQARSSGLTLDQFIASLEQAIKPSEPIRAVPTPAHNRTPEASKPALCPSCGKRRMRHPKDKRPGTFIKSVLLCPGCHYSIFIGGK